MIDRDSPAPCKAFVFSEGGNIRAIVEAVGPREVRISTFWGEVTFAPGLVTHD